MIKTIDLKQISRQISVQDIIKVLEVENSEDLIFISGSLIEGSISKFSSGMGNEYSDIDIFIVTKNYDNIYENKVAYNDLGRKTLFKNSYGLNYDIEVYDWSIFHKIIQEVNNVNLSDINIRTTNCIKLPDGIAFDTGMGLIHRFINSIPLTNHRYYDEIKSELDQNKYFKLLTRYHVNYIDNEYEDVIGNLKANQIEVSAVILKASMLKTMKAFLTYNHISIDRDKWVILNLKNFAEYNEHAKQIYLKFKKLYFANYDDNKAINLIEEGLAFINNIISEIGEHGGI